MARPRNLTLCSFCGKSHAEVRKLVSGLVYICDECIETFKQVLDKELAEEAPKGEAPQLAIKQPAKDKGRAGQALHRADAAKRRCPSPYTITTNASCTRPPPSPRIPTCRRGD